MVSVQAVKTQSRHGLSEAAMTSGVQKHDDLSSEEFELVLVEEEYEEPRVKPSPSLIEKALDEIAWRVAKPKSAARKSGAPKFTFEAKAMQSTSVKPKPCNPTHGIVIGKPSQKVKCVKPKPNGIFIVNPSQKVKCVKPKPCIPTHGIFIAKPSQKVKCVKPKPCKPTNGIVIAKPSQKVKCVKPSQKPGLNM